MPHSTSQGSSVATEDKDVSLSDAPPVHLSDARDIGGNQALNDPTATLKEESEVAVKMDIKLEDLFDDDEEEDEEFPSSGVTQTKPEGSDIARM